MIRRVPIVPNNSSHQSSKRSRLSGSRILDTKLHRRCHQRDESPEAAQDLLPESELMERFEAANMVVEEPIGT